MPTINNAIPKLSLNDGTRSPSSATGRSRCSPTGTSTTRTPAWLRRRSVKLSWRAIGTSTPPRRTAPNPCGVV
jgi:hypothetical protein